MLLTCKASNPSCQTVGLPLALSMSGDAQYVSLGLQSVITSLISSKISTACEMSKTGSTRLLKLHVVTVDILEAP